VKLSNITMWYTEPLQSDTNNGKKPTATVAPVVTTETSVLTSAEQAEFIDSLEAAEAQINPGDAMKYENEAFKDRLFDA
jgi:hypothetical protein